MAHKHTSKGFIPRFKKLLRRRIQQSSPIVMRKPLEEKHFLSLASSRYTPYRKQQNRKHAMKYTPYRKQQNRHTLLLAPIDRE
ncbi:hypothetical protein Dsin_004869 [Dipteronia sinensis]|uniref:Uncharacterized protein n=1 Tax=Dipteronia sinensis TaxID=43782 RepID=A0AAE0EEM5_9ROSI|nr:hypothetical protein Dsin_004859 [Dipteronia sinensis]KAK3225007.1 hypothetical protein Dsin_004869 [Dipteronia sinensis]